MCNSAPLFVIILILYGISNSHGQIVNTGTGLVEFVGLKSWKANSLLDSIKTSNPKESGFSACAGELVDRFGFAEASVEVDNNNNYFISVIEKVDSDKIQYLNPPKDSLTIDPKWQIHSDLINKNRRQAYACLAGYGHQTVDRIGLANQLLKLPAVDSLEVISVWDFLKGHKLESDKDYALWILLKDANDSHRKLAIAVLTNFPESELVWWTLLDAVRDRNQQFGGFSITALDILSERTRNTVNWYPTSSSIRYILNGTNLTYFFPILEILRKTGLSKLDNKEIFSNGGDLLLAYLGSQNKGKRQAVLEFLMSVSGMKYESIEDWKKWIAQLSN